MRCWISQAEASVIEAPKPTHALVPLAGIDLDLR